MSERHDSRVPVDPDLRQNRIGACLARAGNESREQCRGEERHVATNCDNPITAALFRPGQRSIESPERAETGNAIATRIDADRVRECRIICNEQYVICNGT